MARALHIRLTLWYATILATILVGFSVVVYQVMARGLAQATDTALRVSAQQVVDAIDFENGQPQLQAIPTASSALSPSDSQVWLRVVDRQGHVLGGVGRYRDVPMPPDLIAAVQQQRADFATAIGPGATGATRIYSVPFPDDDDHFVGSLQVGQGVGENERILAQLLLSLCLGTGLAVLVACLSGLFMAQRALAPIDQITRTMQQIEAHDLTRRLTLDLPDDVVGRLARMFNQMLTHLEAAFQRQRRFTADAAHEFRTPLAVMKNEIGVALNHPRRRAEYQRVLHVLDDQVNRLTRLTADLLLLARGDSQQEAHMQTCIDLSDMLDSVAQQAQRMAQDAQIDFTTAIAPGLHMLGDRDQLIRLFMNLLDNAIRYTPGGGQVRLVAEPTTHEVGGEQHCAIAIHDTGEGISPHHLPHIFERFYRGDATRSRTVGGTGLGLAIVKQIADAHSGTMTVQSVVGQGTIFTVTFALTTSSVTVYSPESLESLTLTPTQEPVALV